ncbi:SIMPL domain-containing protein [Brevirhabdus sp.]|uniref:SIMPL domain-containing protein n=1 Tax=Brevirhabdus sp. TaxID=2004514 RepID=UPI00405920B8
MTKLVLALVLMLPTALPALAQGPQLADPARMPARMTVTGEGSVDLPPDMATITLGATTQKATAAEALADNSKMVAATLDVLKAEGIAARDMQTSGLRLYPVFDNRPKPDGQGDAPRIEGYRASNTITVRVRDLPRLGVVLDQVVQAGVNEFRGLEFGLSAPQESTDAARRNAIADARRKADLYAQAAGLKIIGILSLDEQTRSQPPGMMRMNAMAARESQVPVAEGEVTLNVDVTITYEIAPAL